MGLMQILVAHVAVTRRWQAVTNTWHYAQFRKMCDAAKDWRWYLRQTSCCPFHNGLENANSVPKELLCMALNNLLCKNMDEMMHMSNVESKRGRKGPNSLLYRPGALFYHRQISFNLLSRRKLTILFPRKIFLAPNAQLLGNRLFLMLFYQVLNPKYYRLSRFLRPKSC